MTSHMFFNNSGKPTSIRNRTGNSFQTAGINGQISGFTNKVAGTTYRYSPSGNLTGIGIKANGMTFYSDLFGKKRTSLPPY